MSQTVKMELQIVGVDKLVAAIKDLGLGLVRERRFRDSEGHTHDVDMVVTDEDGTSVGVKVDEASGRATFVGHDDGSGRGQGLANRVAQRYAYSRVLDELRKKGYRISKEERKTDGTIEIVAQRWRE